MPVSGLVLTLDSTAETAIQALRERPEIELGQRAHHKLPIVVDTPSRQRDRELWAWLRNLPGVVHIDVACIHFDPPGSGGTERGR